MNKGWTLKGTVSFLGEPAVKGKGLELIYPHLGLGLVFQGNWENENSLI